MMVHHPSHFEPYRTPLRRDMLSPCSVRHHVEPYTGPAAPCLFLHFKRFYIKATETYQTPIAKTYKFSCIDSNRFHFALYNMANSTHHASAIGMRTEVGHFFPGYQTSSYDY